MLRYRGILFVVLKTFYVHPIVAYDLTGVVGHWHDAVANSFIESKYVLFSK